MDEQNVGQEKKIDYFPSKSTGENFEAIIQSTSRKKMNSLLHVGIQNLGVSEKSNNYFIKMRMCI